MQQLGTNAAKSINKFLLKKKVEKEKLIINKLKARRTKEIIKIQGAINNKIQTEQERISMRRIVRNQEPRHIHFYSGYNRLSCITLVIPQKGTK